MRLWKLPMHIRHFPGANPVSIEHKDFPRIQKEDFLVALKTDGVRYLLLLTCKPNSSEPIAIMVDRSQKMYEIEIWAHEEFFKKCSLYDGELVGESNQITYVVFDVIVAKGTICSNMTYKERLLVIHNTILCVSDSHDDLSIESMLHEECRFLARKNELEIDIKPKRCVPKSNLKDLWEDSFSSTHKNDGLIFTLNDSPVETGTSSSIFKWKPMHSIDLKFEHADNAWKIYCNANNSSDLIDVSHKLEENAICIEENKFLNAVIPRKTCIIECFISFEGESLKLSPEKERTDKTTPNTLKTVLATVRNAKENISISEIIRVVSE